MWKCPAGNRNNQLDANVMLIDFILFNNMKNTPRQEN